MIGSVGSAFELTVVSASVFLKPFLNDFFALTRKIASWASAVKSDL